MRQMLGELAAHLRRELPRDLLLHISLLYDLLKARLLHALHPAIIQ